MTNLAADASVAGSRRQDAAEQRRRLAKSLWPTDVVALRQLSKLRMPEPRRVLVAAKKAKLPLALAAARSAEHSIPLI